MHQLLWMFATLLPAWGTNMFSWWLSHTCGSAEPVAKRDWITLRVLGAQKIYFRPDGQPNAGLEWKLWRTIILSFFAIQQPFASTKKSNQSHFHLSWSTNIKSENLLYKWRSESISQSPLLFHLFSSQIKNRNLKRGFCVNILKYSLESHWQILHLSTYAKQTSAVL